MIVRIPVELLDEVASSLPKNDALRLASTCRAAYASALPAILSDVVLGGRAANVYRQLQSFSECLATDLPLRASYIHSLTLGASVASFLSAQGVCSNQDDGLADRLARIISHATKLHRLTISKAERLFASASPSITAAVTALTSPSELRFEEYVGPHALRVLATMRCRPSVVELASFDAPMCSAAPAHAREPLLRNLAGSLTSVTLINNHSLFRTCAAGGDAAEPVCPHVERLVLGGVWDIADLPSMARTFPGVRTLEVYARCTDRSVGRDLWTSLDTVLLDRPVPLARPVRRVELVNAEWVKEQFGLAVQMIAALEPEVLVCRDLDYEATAMLAGCTAYGSRTPVRQAHTGVAKSQFLRQEAAFRDKFLSTRSMLLTAN